MPFLIYFLYNSSALYRLTESTRMELLESEIWHLFTFSIQRISKIPTGMEKNGIVHFAKFTTNYILIKFYQNLLNKYLYTIITAFKFMMPEEYYCFIRFSVFINALSF